MSNVPDDAQNPYRSFGSAPPAAVEAPSAPVAADVPDEQTIRRQVELQRRTRSGAAWFYWIVGLSIVNSILLAAQAGFAFIFGLGITQLLDGLAQGLRADMGPSIMVVHLGLYACFVAPLVLFGVFASRGHRWAFVLGMATFALDGLLLVPFQDWLGVCFHALVLYWIWNGFRACSELRAGRSTVQAT